MFDRVINKTPKARANVVQIKTNVGEINSENKSGYEPVFLLIIIMCLLQLNFSIFFLELKSDILVYLFIHIRYFIGFSILITRRGSKNKQMTNCSLPNAERCRIII